MNFSKKGPGDKIVINLANTSYPVVRKVVKRELGWTITYEEFGDGWDLMWHDNGITSDRLIRMQSFQKISQFPGIFNISKKNYMTQNLAAMRKGFPKDYNFFPRSWVLPQGYNELKA